MYYIGLDVHKRKISYCVKDEEFYTCAPPERVRRDFLPLDKDLSWKFA
jgi:hypothetical protein